MSKLTPRILLARQLANGMPEGLPRAARRQFLQRASAAVFAAGFAPALLSAAEPPPRPRFTADPFTLGVASGYPRPDRVVLWTRLAPQPLDGGGIPDDKLFVQWQLARDEGFADIAAEGWVPAFSALGHSVHVEPRGLQPDRVYFYRFRCGDARSAIGRTRTAPATGAAPRHLKLALGSCQHYEQGYFGAYRQLLADGTDLMVFVGDYVYDNSWGKELVRRHSAPKPSSLLDYRNRHAQYKLDRDLQAAHAAIPWVSTWDDHEVDNDYAGDQTESLDPQLLLRRAAAYQAYYEHMPMPRSMLPRGPDMRIYTTVDYGDLARIVLLDNRQYRSPQACQGDNRGGSATVADCAELADPARTLLGTAQQQWLEQRFADSAARWNVIAQQTLFARQQQGAAGNEFWTDAWDGYPAAREQVLAAMEKHRLRNPLMLGGDVHAFYAADIKRDYTRPDSATLGSELCTTSLSADGLDQALLDGWRPHNPHIHLSRADVRGYALLELGRERCTARLQVSDSVKAPESRVSTLASFVTEEGRPGWQRA